MSKSTRKTAIQAALILVACIQLISVPLPAAKASGDVAVKSNQPIYIDGWSALMTAYNINGNNFVRLRDIAYYIDFGVIYDSAVKIDTTAPYAVEQSALGKTPERAETVAKQLQIYVDDHFTTMLAYNIEGNNYVKLRDIGAVVDFNVEWDAARKRVLIDTSKPYAQEAAETTEPIPAPNTDIPGGTSVDYSLQANPEIFDWYFTREKFNTDRQRVLDTGEIATGWGIFIPTSANAITVADRFFEDIMQMSTLDKVKSINRLLCNHMIYSANTAFSGNDFWISTAYGVCEDYSQIFRYLCYRASVPCIYVTGIADGNGHAWNEVYIDSAWQFYDGNLSDIRQSIVLGETAIQNHTYTAGSPQSIMYYKEIFVPGSTL